MYKRIIIVSVIILAALCGLGWLGYHSIRIRAKGMEGARLGEFAAVSEQIRQDVKRKLDEFMQIEQKRPYTDYQYYYVPQNIASVQQQMLLLRSPLADRIENNLAYGNFQIESDGTIVTPYYRTQQSQIQHKDELSHKAEAHISNIKRNLLGALNGSVGMFKLPSRGSDASHTASRSLRADVKDKQGAAKKRSAKGKGARAKEYRIQSLEKDSQREQIFTQRRQVVAGNVAQSTAAVEQQLLAAGQPHPGQTAGLMQTMETESPASSRLQVEEDMVEAVRSQSQTEQLEIAQVSEATEQADTVQIRIEPFVPLVVGGDDAGQSIFGGQVFLLRHVQIENRHFLQGFQLNEKTLLGEIEDSAKRFMRDGMGFELSQSQNADAAYAAILDFGFGELVLSLMEIDPARIGKDIGRLRNWYFSIIGIVLLAVMLGLVSLWRNARAQVKLAQKKDDFISAVSHELRTPLTSIRMYSEMLEKNWVKSEDKLAEYYKNMRQESERLSRLIENVLDFSRIQKGRKKYTFSLGDINKCIADVVEMMRPYAAQTGFSIKTDFEQLEQTAFDSDAVAQIVVNLLDNAVKYARDAADKTITVRTRPREQFILIEVQDHGPGVPHHQRKKVFEQFYRTGSEATRETNGTGLGLALVKKFAEAHNGFVEILAAKPMGAVFRVGLAMQS